MNKYKILTFSLLIILFAFTIWYLFLKGYNYKIRFDTNQPPGTVYATLTNWDKLDASDFDSLGNISKTPFKEIKYSTFKADSVFDYTWKIERKNDSTTQVVAYVTDKENSFEQNFSVPFKKNNFVARNVNEVENVMMFLKELDEVYGLELLRDSTVTVEPIFCAYVPVNSTISGKATAMFENISKVMGYIRSNKLELSGNPFLTVNNLDVEKGTINFDFCFPLKEVDSLPQSDVVKFKTTEEFKAIKAIYNGNYRSTEYAWFELIDYAKNQGIDYIAQPMEIYRNDPQTGTDAKDWVAEVFLPIK